jgi:hypothetical protein
MSQAETNCSSATYQPSAGLTQVERLGQVLATRAQRTAILNDLACTEPVENFLAINGPSGSGTPLFLTCWSASIGPPADMWCSLARAYASGARICWRGCARAPEAPVVGRMEPVHSSFR